MEKVEKNKRIMKIRASLRYGDITKIAQKAGVTREWVSYVLLEQGVSERVLEIAEEQINSRSKVKITQKNIKK